MEDESNLKKETIKEIFGELRCIRNRLVKKLDKKLTEEEDKILLHYVAKSSEKAITLVKKGYLNGIHSLDKLQEFGAVQQYIPLEGENINFLAFYFSIEPKKDGRGFKCVFTLPFHSYNYQEYMYLPSMMVTEDREEAKKWEV